jgi:hypothetical protein
VRRLPAPAQPQGLTYSETRGDEVEDLYALLAYVKVTNCVPPTRLHDDTACILANHWIVKLLREQSPQGRHALHLRAGGVSRPQQLAADRAAPVCPAHASDAMP